MSRQTLQSHVFTCATCGKSFESRDRNQLSSARRNRHVYCSPACRSEMESRLRRTRPGKHECGPCPGCGVMFASKIAGKRFCSLDCYVKSEELLIRLAKLNEERSKDWRCRMCHKECRSGRMYCSDFCRRKFFVERFDRFIASPETIALPQNFDEFLTRDELPCLFDGCEWVGTGLSHHVNFHHGVTPDDFRKMVGFNKTTALMGVSARESRSAIMKRLIDDGVITPCRFDVTMCERVPHDMRLEGREHWKKAVALSGGMGKFIAAGVRWATSDKGRKRNGELLKQRIERDPLVVLVCAECGIEYKTKQMLSGRSKFCGQKCRNAANNRKRRLAKTTSTGTIQ